MPAAPLPDPIGAVLALASLRSPRCGDTLVVAVDGPSGSGKTSLAAALATRLTAPVVHLDDLYPGWDGLADAVPLLVTQVLEPLARGERAAYRRWDWDRHRWAGRVPVPAAPVLVVEGCGSCVAAAGRYAAVRVWVEADRDVRFRRGMERDGEGYRPHWERWARQEDALFAVDRTRQRADVLVDTTPALVPESKALEH